VRQSRAIGPYTGTLRALVHALKYDKHRSLARALGRMMREHGRDVIEAADIVVPVPLHRRRARQRGFNQADDLAREIGLPVVDALRRVRATPSQTDLPAARRHANVRDAFALRRGVDLRGLRVLIVDDVCTTGATIEACARVLRRGGAVEVSALTAARVESRPRG
jgi:ComF family protein